MKSGRSRPYIEAAAKSRVSALCRNLSDPTGAVARLPLRRTETCHRRALVRAGCAERKQGRLPGLRAFVADLVAQHGNSRALRVRLLAPQTPRRRRGYRGRAKPRVDSGLDGRLVGLRPHQRHQDHRAIRRGHPAGPAGRSVRYPGCTCGVRPCCRATAPSSPRRAPYCAGSSAAVSWSSC
jgi:hypothetical protein